MASFFNTDWLVKTMNRHKSCQILGVSQESSFNDIKYAYRKLALELHPDKNISEKAEEKFKLVTEAYHFLKSDQRRQDSKQKEDFAFRSRTKSTASTKNENQPQKDWSRFTKEAEEAYQGFSKQYETKFWETYEPSPAQAARAQQMQEEVEETNDDIDVNVEVDRSLCIGCCSCETIAPTVFAVDKTTRMNPKSHVINKDGATSERILDAAQTCPTKAISVEDIKLGRRLYPYK